MDTETRFVKHYNETITYFLTRKKVKNINLHIRARDGSVQVSASKYIDTDTIDRFVQKNADFVLKALKKYENENNKRELLTCDSPDDGSKVIILGKELTVKTKISSYEKIEINDNFLIIFTADNNRTTCNRIYRKWLDDIRKTVYSDALNKYFPLFKSYCKDKPELIIKKSVSRWGYCNVYKNTVMLNEQLISTPLPLIEYVALHELTHFAHPDHSKEFWKHMEAIMADCRLRRKALKNYSFLL